MNRFVTVFHTMRFAILGFCLLLAVCVAHAQNATWSTAPTVAGPDPASFDFNAPNNWTPATVPTGTASFGMSAGLAISFSSAATSVGALQYNAGANAYSLQVNPATTFTINGTGVTNNGSSQVIVSETNAAGQQGTLLFANSATAGSNVFYRTDGAVAMNSSGGIINFTGSSNAGSADFVNGEGNTVGGAGGRTQFVDTGTSAANANFRNFGTSTLGASGGITNFLNGTAANATIRNGAGDVATMSLLDNTQARTLFQNSATAANSTITNVGAMVTGAFGGETVFFDTSTAGSSTITSNGGMTAGAHGGLTLFSADGANVHNASNAGNSTLIANGGTNGGDGGEIRFLFYSSGATARVEVFGNGKLDISSLFSDGTTIGSLEGDGDVFLGSKNLDIGGNDMDTTFSGLIQDGGVVAGTGGSITKSGLGMLTLTSDNTYTGGTTVNDGVLAIGSLNAMGTGNVTVNGGTLQTFNGPRAMAVGGNYVQNPGGTLRLQIGGLDSGSESDYLTVNGSATLGGTLSLVRLNNFNPPPGSRVDIIGDLGGHTGQFDNVVSDFTGMFQPVVHYDEPFDIYIVFQLSSFVLEGLTPNQRAVAHQLNQVVGDPRASELFDFLFGEPLENLPHDYDLIAPEELASMYEIGFSQAVVHNGNLMRRMDAIRAGSNGYCGPVVQTMPSAKDYTPAVNDKNVVPDKNVTPSALVPCPDNPWGVFVIGSGDFVNVGDDDSNARGYDLDTGSVTVGVDYRIGQHFALGIDVTYDNSHADLIDDGKINMDGGKIGGYGTWFGDGLLHSRIYVQGGVEGGWNNYDTRRTGLDRVAPMGGYDDIARGSTDGSELDAFVAYGSDWTFGCFTIGTWSSIQYTRIDLNGFTEHGSLVPLEFPDQDEDSLRGTTGIHMSYDWKFGSCGIVRPEVRAAWQHESNDRAYEIESRFASGAGDVFTVHGPKVGSDSALVGAGVNVQLSARFATYVYYDGVLGRTNYDNNAVSGGFRFSF